MCVYIFYCNDGKHYFSYVENDLLSTFEFEKAMLSFLCYYLRLLMLMIYAEMHLYVYRKY